MFLSAGLDLRLHSVSDGAVVHHHHLHHSPTQSRIVALSVCNDNSYIALLRLNERPQIHSLKDRQNVRLVHTINIPNATSLTFKRLTKKTIALGTGSGDVVLYDTKLRKVSAHIPKVVECVRALDFTSDDGRLCGLDRDVFFVFPDLNSHKVVKYKQQVECALLRCHPFIPNLVMLGHQDGHVSLWDAHQEVVVFSAEGVEGGVAGAAMSSCGKFLVVAGRDVKICSVDRSVAPLHLLQDRGVSAVGLSPGDRFLAVGLVDGTLKVYDLKEQLKEVFCGKVDLGPLGAVVFENGAREANGHFEAVFEEAKRSEAKEDEASVGGTSARSVEMVREESLEKMKRTLMKVVKSEMDSLEIQLHEHCIKFQKFLDNEFETIDNIIKKKWDIFNVGDMNQIIKAICPDDSKTNCT